MNLRIDIEEFEFENLKRFIFFGSLVNNTSGTKKEMKRRIHLADINYFGQQKYF